MTAVVKPCRDDGLPFTIGEVIHTSRSQGFVGYLGGVAVFQKLLSPAEMKRLARTGREGELLRPATLSHRK